MAQEQLRYRISADSSGFVKEANKATAAVGRMNKGTSKSGQAFTQLAYALDDAQYGFRGIQNNIQAIAVSAGASGPLVLGITAATVALGYLVEKTDLFNSKADPHKAKIKELADEYRNLRDAVFGGEPNTSKLIGNINEQIEEQKRVIQDLKKTVTVGGYNTSHTTTVGSPEEIAAAELQLTILQERLRLDEEAIKKIEDKKQAAKDYADELKRIRDSEDIAIFASEEGLGSSDMALGEAFRLLPEQEINEAVETLNEFDTALEDLESALQQVGSPLAGLSEQMAKDFMKIDEAMLTTTEKSQMFANAFIGAFESAASQGGNFLEVLAKGLLSSLGSILIQMGSAAIMAGIAKNAIVPGSGAASIKKGSLVTAAGVALKAGSSIIGKGAASGSTSSSTGRAISYASPTANPSRSGGGANGGRIVGELELRGQNLVVALQTANETRNRF